MAVWSDTNCTLGLRKSSCIHSLSLRTPPLTLGSPLLGNCLRRHAASEHPRSHITLASFQPTSHR